MESIFNDIKRGRPILVYEPEEDEFSMMILANKMNISKMRLMKKYASGDIGVAISYELASKIKIPFLHELIISHKKKIPNIKKSSLSLLIDHVKAKTGSSDKDKLLLIKEIASAAKSKNYEKFAKNIYIPGHLKFFIAAKGLLDSRQGHTELNVALARLSGLKPYEIAIVMCSLRNPKNGKMITKKDLNKFADLKKLPIIDRDVILRYWREEYGQYS
ncbi:MAG: 3,4-dihydroxy-2-butanone-4-phosphate synthase [Candidatus Micrarchaeia archaeon]